MQIPNKLGCDSLGKEDPLCTRGDIQSKIRCAWDTSKFKMNVRELL